MLSQQKESDSAKQSKNLVYAWDGVIIYVTQEHLNKAHAHFPALLQISCGTPFAITVDEQPRSYHEVVVMASNLPHSTDSENQPYIAILIDPDHASAETVTALNGLFDDNVPSVAPISPYVPEFIHAFDVEGLSKVLPEHGFKVEKVGLFNYPDDTTAGDTGHIGFVAQKI